MNIECINHLVIPLIYVLQCEDECWYVGYSENINKRLAAHFNGSGSLWCKEHRPIAINEIFYGTKEDETAKTIELMKRFGISKVRGGVYTAVNKKVVSYETRAKYGLVDVIA